MSQSLPNSRDFRCVTISSELLRSMPLPEPDESADKDGRGSVLVVGGSPELIGAVILAGLGALRAGAGRLRVAVPGSIAPYVGMSLLEARVFVLPETSDGGIDPIAAGRLTELAAGVDCILIGPGLSDAPSIAEILKAMLPSDKCAGKTLILDAAALEALPRVFESSLPVKARLILTPHASEMAKLLAMEREAIEDNPIGAASEAASRFNATVALKGSVTWIVEPSSETIYRNDAGNIGLATSGSGDTLAGIIAGLAARGAAPLRAACWGVHAHAAAGDRLLERFGSIGFLARELLDETPRVLHFLAAGTRE